MPNFIGGLPAESSPLKSSEIRNNFLALDARTGKITARATNPSSTSVNIEAGVIYFENKTEVAFSAQSVDLGNTTTGIKPFINIGFFKDVALVLRLQFNSTTGIYSTSAEYIEGPEKASAALDTRLVPIRATDLPVARFVVRHNGVNIVDRGQIEPVDQDQIQDYRNYLDVGGMTYYSATVGNRVVETDAYGVLETDAYGAPVFSGETIGSFVDDRSGTNVIQQAIDSLADTGGTILIRRGQYEISETIEVPSNIRIVGEGSSTIIQKLVDFTGTSLFFVTGSSVGFSNLKIVGAKVSGEALIRFSSSSKSSVINCFLESGTRGVHFDSGERNICTNNFFYDNTLGVEASGSDRNIISLNQFEDNTDDFDAAGTNSTTGNIESTP